MSDNEQNGLMDFMDRFGALADEALSYGIESVIIVSEYDHIRGVTPKGCVRKCCAYRALGLLTMQARDLQAEIESDVNEDLD